MRFIFNPGTEKYEMEKDDLVEEEERKKRFDKIYHCLDRLPPPVTHFLKTL